MSYGGFHKKSAVTAGEQIVSNALSSGESSWLDPSGTRRAGQSAPRAPISPLRFNGASVSTTPLAQVAQLVEHVTENHGVGGSIPPLGTRPHI
jgi:hypothetical protein